MKPGTVVRHKTIGWEGVVVADRPNGFGANGIVTVEKEGEQSKWLDCVLEETGETAEAPEPWPTHPIGGYPINPSEES